MNNSENSNDNKFSFKNIISTFGILFTLVAAALYMFADKVYIEETERISKTAIVITFIGYVIVFLATIIVNLILKFCSIHENFSNEIVNKFTRSNEELLDSANAIDTLKDEFNILLNSFTENVDKERNIIAELEISQFVLNTKEVVDLEASVANYDDKNKRCKIYIQSSLFELEKGPLEKAIIWNLRKGVKYIYIIPDKDVYRNEYNDMLKDWYKLFSMFLNSKDDYYNEYNRLQEEPEYLKYWNSEYQTLFNEAGKLWGNNSIADFERDKQLEIYRSQCKNIFKKQIESHINDESEFFITVAVYEVRKNKWQAIIKLPTQNPNYEYYAFQLPSKNRAETTAFIHSFQNRFKSCQYVVGDNSTLGGKINLDFSIIFND